MQRKQHLFSTRLFVSLFALLTAATAWADGLSGSGTPADPYIINSDADYDVFATTPAYWASGAIVRLTADVNVTKMVGTENNKYMGMFFGNGHTLNVTLTSDGDNCAPFRYAEGATFTGLHTTGTVTTSSKFATGLIGSAAGNVTIRNCWSSVNIISSVSGDGTHGGFVGVTGAKTLIENSLFDGVICCTSAELTNNCGGFVGWRNNTLTIKNCLYAPASLPEGKYAIGTSECSTFSRNSVTPDNSYYTTTLGGAQGTSVGSMTKAELATALGSGWQLIGENESESVVPVMSSNSLANATVSGVQPYYLYTGSEIPVTYMVTDFNGALVTLGSDFTAEFSPATVQESGDYTLTLTGIGSYTGTKVVNFTVGEGIPVTSSTTTFKDSQIYKVSSNVTVSSRISVSGTATLLLGEGTTLTASKGIELSSGNQLTIDGTGTLTINDCEKDKSGIGAYEVGTLIINGGTINANGGSLSAGIGGSYANANGGSIIINGGIVNATGGWLGAGIGGGYDNWNGNYGQCGTITINGGQVTATGGTDAPGIGPGYSTGQDNESGTVTLGWTNVTDFIYASSYGTNRSIIHTLAFADGKNFVLDDTMEDATTSNISGKKIIPFYDGADKNLHYTVISGIETSYYYTGSAISVVPVVKDKNSNTLTLDTDYTLALTLNGEPATEVNATGQYTMTFTAKDGSNYVGSKSVSFSVIYPAPTNLQATAFAGTSVTLTWTQFGSPSQWTVEYSKNNTFATSQTVTVNTTTATLEGLTEEETYYARVKVADNENLENVWSTTFLFVPTSKVVIGLGSDNNVNLPFKTGDAYSVYGVTQQIYTASEMGVGSDKALINSIDFFDNAYDCSRTIDIYMVNTAKSSFNDTQDWIPVSEADKVFSNTVSFKAKKWTTITLDKTFVYDGTGNIAIIVDDNTDSSGSATNFSTFSTENHQTLYIHGSSIYDPTNMSSTTGYCPKVKNQIRLDIEHPCILDDNDILANAEEKNSAIIANKANETTNVYLAGRTLYKDGEWNTICLPFDVTLAGSPLAGATAKTLTDATINGTTVSLTFGDAVDKLQAGVPYIIKWDEPADLVIKSASDWHNFATDVEGGNTFAGKVVRLSADITVSEMVGTSSNRFSGIFEGDGHTLTLNDLSATSEFCAPFRYVNGATINNLHTAGTVKAGSSTTNDKYRSGLIGETTGTTAISNCWSSVNITSEISGDGTHGGFIGVSQGTTTITNSRFDGSITGNTTHSCGGFVGWRNNTLTIKNCVFAPSGISLSNSGNATFSRSGVTLTNSYYTQSLGTVQGSSASGMSNDDLLTALGSNWHEIDSKVVPIMGKFTSTIENPMFTGVTIDANAERTISKADGDVQFKGYYDAFSINATNTNIYYMTAGNTLKHTGVDRTLKGCRAYFQFGGDANAARNIVLDFGDGETTALSEALRVKSEESESATAGWYAVDGRKLGKQPTRKGLYIFNGNKIVVK